MVPFRTSAVALLASTVLAVALVSCGDDGSTRSPVSKLVDVGGRNLHLECSGTGSPTVILQSGFSNAGDIWSTATAHAPAVQPGIARTNRVCSYDRPGSTITTATAGGTVATSATPRPGRSDAVPMPRDPADVVAELHDLLAAAKVPGPYVLVGHSLGGTLNLLYARTYPAQVHALVVVDSPLPPLRAMITADQWDASATLRGDPDALPGYEHEAYDLGVLFDEIAAAPPLPDVPVIVLVRGEIRLGDDPVPPDLEAEITAINRAQRAAQAEFAAGVPGAELITVPGTTHYIQTQRPDAVITAIHDVTNGRWSP